MGQCCWWTKAQEGHNKHIDHIDARGLEVSNLQYLLVCESFVDQILIINSLFFYIQLQKTTQHELDQIANRGIRCGATIDPERRSKEYAREGYQGVMYYAATTNMKTAENRLLHAFNFEYNKQRNSNVAEEKGYVYIITGEKL